MLHSSNHQSPLYLPSLCIPTPCFIIPAYIPTDINFLAGYCLIDIQAIGKRDEHEGGKVLNLEEHIRDHPGGEARGLQVGVIAVYLLISIYKFIWHSRVLIRNGYLINHISESSTESLPAHTEDFKQHVALLPFVSMWKRMSASNLKYLIASIL